MQVSALCRPNQAVPPCPCLTPVIHILMRLRLPFTSCYLFPAQRTTNAFPLSIRLSPSLINLVNNIYQHFDEEAITESETRVCVCVCARLSPWQEIYDDNQRPRGLNVLCVTSCASAVLCMIIMHTSTTLTPRRIEM